MNLNKYEYSIHILLVGNSKVGKSSLVNKYTNNKFTEDYNKTILLDYKRKILILNDNKTLLNIWDVSGDNSCRYTIQQYYNNIDVCIVVFDLTNRQSFNYVTDRWIQDIDKNASTSKQIIKLLVGTKADMMYNIEISADEIQNFINKYKFRYFETSAKNNKNVDVLFLHACTEAFPNLEKIQKSNGKYNCYAPLLPKKKSCIYKYFCCWK